MHGWPGSLSGCHAAFHYAEYCGFRPLIFFVSVSRIFVKPSATDDVHTLYVRYILKNRILNTWNTYVRKYSINVSLVTAYHKKSHSIV